MQRYFIDCDLYEHDKIRIQGDDYHHIVHVMRMKPGDQVGIVFPDGRIAISEIMAIHAEFVELKINNWDEKQRELPLDVTIAISLLKKDNFDKVVQKATELGASRIIPLMMERTIVKLEEKKAEKRRARWQKIAKEAAEQSERNKIPVIEKITTLEKLLSKKSAFDAFCVAYEEAGRDMETAHFGKTLRQLKKGQSLLFVFGPEGGFAEREIQLLAEQGAVFCGLGPRILRAETAPLYTLSAISFYFELMR